ncbi:ABC transporter permease [Mycoplasma zalophidermidis]|uniref:ABC transporter permease n=1 Tax=Mycoplasma zalophidermidis TaxID=398174 RepID=A0ABS6DQL9_9MOLU|nr:ABC transporter permease [Mycoplasma zalophidermidis]MBU4690033.1 ABC transporter permease [Mycoplasma zalophidermidis]MBU4693295.1 ABC transporter permease [Mycoplasma zalophidermidis]MCR8966409.1 ABC transporter permease [Mycoplasma zalophidermidis]
MNSKLGTKLALNKRLLMLLPYIAIAIFLIILPVILIIVQAFTPRENFDNAQLVKEFNTWKIIGRSLKIGVISAILCLLIGFPYAYFTATSRSKILPIYAMSLILSPMIIFTIAKIYAIRGFFLSMFDEDVLNAEWFMILALTYLNLPYMIMPLYSVFRDMPKNIIEASGDLGYNKIKTLFKVVIPYSFKAILSGLSLIFLASATTFVISDKLLSNPAQLQTVGSLINQYSDASNAFELSAGSVLVLVVSAIFIGCYGIINFLPRAIIKLAKRGKHV